MHWFEGCCWQPYWLAARQEASLAMLLFNGDHSMEQALLAFFWHYAMLRAGTALRNVTNIIMQCQEHRDATSGTSLRNSGM